MWPPVARDMNRCAVKNSCTATLANSSTATLANSLELSCLEKQDISFIGLRARQLSRVVPEDADFLCDQVAVLRDRIKGPFSVCVCGIRKFANM
jgi:hypothetical protein